jgi:hypothetical protein
MTHTCIDLCSGLGGFSQAFLDRGWNVIRIDNDPRFKDVPNTVIESVREVSDYEERIRLCGFNNVNIVLASPPCQTFSVAAIYKYWNKGIPALPETVMGIRIVMWCLDAIDALKPKYWVLENPRGMLRHILGPPAVTTYLGAWGHPNLKPTDLWGNLLGMAFPPKPTHIPASSGCGKNRNKGRTGKDLRPSNPALRAKIPYKLSEAICLACEEAL